jgi:diguanylate cyclase (GGDEF)-like protein
VPLGETYTAAHSFSESLPLEGRLRIRASMQDIKIYLDNTLIFEDSNTLDGVLHSPEASVWHFVHLPADVAGKTLRIEYSSNLRAFSGLINEIQYGTGVTLLRDVLFQEWSGIAASFILITMGVMMVIISLFLVHIGDRRFLYLGLFAIVVGVWVLSEAKVMQLFTGNRMLIGGISYMMVPLMPILMLLYIKTAVIDHHEKLFNALIAVFLLDFFINIGLQLSGKMVFLDSLQLTNAMILLTLVWSIFILINAAYKHRNTEAKRFLMAFGILGGFVTFEMAQFFSQSLMKISHATRIGLLLFFFILGMDSMKYMNKLYRDKNEAEFFKKMVYRDILTGGFNRAAFERDIKKRETGSYRLITCDLNDLKIINDNFGHPVGDQALINAYESLSKTFRNYGTCYRLGGDEFGCIIDPIDEPRTKVLFEELDAWMESLSTSFPHPLVIAYGSEIYQGEQLEQFIKKVDQRMYDHKQFLKETELK